MIATLVAPILWLGALERFIRWRTNRNAPARGALLTALALAVMVSIDTPWSLCLLAKAGMPESEVVTVERILLLVGCFGALLSAFALDGRLTRRRLLVWSLPLVFVVVTIAVMDALGDRGGSRFDATVRLAVETALVYSCLGMTASIVALASWRASRRSRVHRTQLRMLAAGGLLLAVVAVGNVLAGGVLMQMWQVNVWVLRVNRLVLDTAFACWTLVLMAAWVTSILRAVREWLQFGAAYEQVTRVFPDLQAKVRPDSGWAEWTEAHAVVVLDGWAMLASPGAGRLGDASPAERAAAVARWLDRTAPYSSVHAVDLEPPPDWRAARWAAAVTKSAQHIPSPLLERVH